MKFSFGIPVILAALLSGCFGTEHLASMDHNTERLANEVERDHAEIKTLNESTRSMSEEMSAYRSEFKSLNQNTKSMADEVGAYRKYADTLTAQMTKMTVAIESLAEMKTDLKGLNQNTKQLADDIGSYRKHLDILTEQIVQMVKMVEGLSKFGTETVNTIMGKMFRTGEKSQAAAKKAADEEINLEDILKAADGNPSETEPEGKPAT